MMLFMTYLDWNICTPPPPPPPNDDWVLIAKDIEETSNLPNVIGALDGYAYACPPKTRMQYHNYRIDSFNELPF